MTDDKQTAGDAKQALKRVYGRGFYDGLRAATAAAPTNEEPMTETKFNAVYRSVSEQAKKVYAAVPIEERWTLTQIMAELSRTTGQREQRVVSGCLNSLKEVGLVKEYTGGVWGRTEVRLKSAPLIESDLQPTQPTQEVMPAINTKPKAQESTTTPLERIGGLSSQVLTIIQTLHQLAADIDAAAIEVEEQIQKVHKDSTRLKQLQELLKGLQE